MVIPLSAPAIRIMAGDRVARGRGLIGSHIVMADSERLTLLTPMR